MTDATAGKNSPPASQAGSNETIEALAQLIQHNQPVTAVTGAGISASSGLPVYRDAGGNWIHSAPVQGPDFRASEKIRQRYWCRSYFGWQSFSSATPNDAHKDLALLEKNKLIKTVITQNVDGLHQTAGSESTVALHGNLSEVICLNCGDISLRADLQHRLQKNNPEFLKIEFEVAPDGDAIVDDAHIEQFNTVACTACGGVLQPYVVFYGDSVPKLRVQHCMQQLKESRLLLCIGTSLMVYSSFRFCKAAADADIPVVIVNNGITRADDLASLKFNGDCTGALRQLKQLLL